VKTPQDHTRRFSDRVQHYVRSRPDYPRAFYTFLQTDLGLTRDWAIADIGSGTGISARPLLESGNTVYGIEPNGPMRQAAGQYLAAFPHFKSLDATAEATTLPDHSIDLILAAQAFHWFDRTRARAEFVRVLKPGGWLVLVWNERRLDASPFLREYEALLQRYGTDYGNVRHENVDDAAIRAFFAPAHFQTRTFYNQQRFDYAGLESRLLSSSYTPAEGDPRHAPMLAELKSLFDRHQHAGHVTFEYDTRAHYGQLL
jgi:SAM-dependent methyltransferase